MKVQPIWKPIQRHLGVPADGKPGSGTAKAVSKALGIAAEVPKESEWPKDSTSALIEFYGQPGANQGKVHLPYTMRLSWDLDYELDSFTCHIKVEAPLRKIFEQTLAHYGEAKIRELRLDRFGGCLNVRKKRGGSTWSVHAFGAAVDLDPSNNRLRWNHTRATFARPEYEPFWDIVEANGATSLGRERDYDWMHFQFAEI